MTVALIVGAATSAAPSEDRARDRRALAVSVHVTPHLLFEGGAVRAVVRTPRDAANRRVIVTIDGGTFFASSERQIDGERGRARHDFTWTDLPGGVYIVSATLEQVDGGAPAARACFVVIGQTASEREEDARARRRGAPGLPGPPADASLVAACQSQQGLWMDASSPGPAASPRPSIVR